MHKITLFTLSLFCLISAAYAQDKLLTSKGEVQIHVVGHASLYLNVNGTIIHIDPWSRVANYDSLPAADLILITHQHRDHLDTIALKAITKPETYMIIAPVCLDHFRPAAAYETISNNQKTSWKGIEIESVAAYNLVHMRPNGQPYHPKGEGNGYVINIGGKRIYVAGDTENIPEMEQLGTIDVAFLPVNLPFTMTPEMLADAVLKVNPAVVYPYHYGQTNLERVQQLIREVSAAEIRIR
ncbi:MAG TPA: MBL fold metallo-hydrolase [Bacteroidales bacterium]|nr:MBL fold metallo-hydrolase [Bacteroidales bacterium]